MGSCNGEKISKRKWAGDQSMGRQSMLWCRLGKIFIVDPLTQNVRLPVQRTEIGTKICMSDGSSTRSQKMRTLMRPALGSRYLFHRTSVPLVFLSHTGTSATYTRVSFLKCAHVCMCIIDTHTSAIACTWCSLACSARVQASRQSGAMPTPFDMERSLPTGVLVYSASMHACIPLI
jgi:hypothetical protein